MMLTTEQIQKQLEELHLLQCSLLADEHFSFLDDDFSSPWANLLERYTGDPSCTPVNEARVEYKPATFRVELDGADVWFEAKMSVAKDSEKEDSESLIKRVRVKGRGMAKGEQEKWIDFVNECSRLEEIVDSEYPIYQLISTYLIPRLRDETEIKPHSSSERSSSSQEQSLRQKQASEPYHVLFTSHHLISPNKRRSLQSWSSSLSLTGFAKVGYPGVIYAQGEKANVEEFVANVKAMQWLALRVRFTEPLPCKFLTNGGADAKTEWKEFQRVGEVVDEMRGLGREEYVVEMGIGSTATK